MYCRICGKEIKDEAVVCPHCGCAVKEEPIKNYEEEYDNEKSDKINIMSLVGFILSLISLFLALWGTVAIVGLILSIIGLVQCNQNGERLKGLASAGIIISIGSLCYTCYVLGIF